MFSLQIQNHRRALVQHPFPGSKECDKPWPWQGLACLLEKFQQRLPTQSQHREKTESHHNTQRFMMYLSQTNYRRQAAVRTMAGAGVYGEKYRRTRFTIAWSTTKVRARGRVPKKNPEKLCPFDKPPSPPRFAFFSGKKMTSNFDWKMNN